MNKSMSDKFYKNIMFWFGVAGLFSVILTAYNIFYRPHKGLEFKIEKIVDLFDIKDDGINLKVFLKDSIEIQKDLKNISIYELEIKNEGSENISVSDFDSNLGFGINLTNGEIIQKPEILNSSDIAYYSDVIKQVSSERIIFKNKIIDSDNYFSIKFFVLHDRQQIPTIKSFGRISGQGSIPVLDRSLTENEIIEAKDEKINLVFISLVFTLLGFAGLVYAYLKLIKNQILIANQRNIIENLHVENDNLIQQIEDLEDKKPR